MHRSSLSVLLLLLWLCACPSWHVHGAATPAGKPVSETCPGAAGRRCTRQCQLHTCQALADVYRSSNNVSDPWDQEHGWEDTATQSCQQLLAAGAGAGGLPTYCGWHGVSCCTAARATNGSCLVHGVSELNLSMNNLNVSLEDPVFFGGIKVLHDCGLTVLNLESSNVGGMVTEEWGQLDHFEVLVLANAWVHGSIPRGIRNMRNLTVFNIGNNWFSGSLPDWLPELERLRVLNLGSQFGGNNGSKLLGLRGTIPAEIGGMGRLRELILESNSLVGTLPDALCHKGSSLLLLSVRGNLLEGSAREVEDCSRLVQLDISSNAFSGSLPASSKWERLATYTASYNQFTGSWPPALSDVRTLQYLDISHNRLTGLLPPKITLMGALKSVKLNDNKFAGTVVEDLYFLPALAVLDLSNNQFVGTTPVAIGLSYSLAEVDLSNNTGITGELPAQLGLLPELRVVKFMQTNLSCAGIIQPYSVTTNTSCSDPRICRTPQRFGDEPVSITRCTQDELLPCFLRFSDYFLPREDSSNMRCKQIIRKPADTAQHDCGGSGPGQLGALAQQIPDKSRDRWARWEVDPAYYQYQACECLLGFRPVWDDTRTVMRCVEQQQSSTQNRSIIIAAAIASAAVLAVALVVWRQYLRTRPRWLRERTLQAKRSKGAPKASKPGSKVLVSIVVTDVKDFSDLTRRFPELMNKAMGGHNNILRKACHAHAGHVMDQEGDSWTIVFHAAEDAAAFALQVQQTLNETVWSLRLATLSPPHRTGSQSTQTSEPSTNHSYGLMGCDTGSATPQTGPHAPHAAGMSGAAGLGKLPRQHGSFSGSSDLRGSSVVGLGSRDCSFTSGVLGQHDGAAVAAITAPQQAGDAVVDMGSSSRDAKQQRDQQPHACAAAQLPDGVAHSKSSFSVLRSLWGRGQDAGGGSPFLLHQQDSQTTVSTAHSSRPTSRLYSAGSMLMTRLTRVMRTNLGSGTVGSAGQHDIQQLRLSVRMGIATGWLPYGCTLESSAVTERAKNYVSEVANGGQVLLDEQTFKHIKHHLSTLGTVDENGYNHRQLQQRLHAEAVAKMRRRVTCGTGCCSFVGSGGASAGSGPEEQPRDYDTDALVVHMGGFRAPATSQRGLGSSSHGQQPLSASDASGPSAEEEDDLCEEPASAGVDTRRRGKQRGIQLQLYAIAAPKMRRLPQHSSELQSCASWCQPVRVKPGWVQVQKDYFAAPGARPGDLAPSSQQDLACGPPLPPITFVFAEVGGVHKLSHKHHKSQLHAVNRTIQRCMLQQMAALPGRDGYLCRSHELKFMVAFESPVRAVQWCLLVQDALMYEDWPDQVLRLPGFHEERDPASGQLLFRGPRLGMGVSEGIPGSVLPEHQGHANYTGGAVNRAARFADAAAQPGQVVCDVHFAKRCFEAWAAHAASTTTPLPASGRQSWGSVLGCTSPESIPESSAATDWGDLQVSLMQLMALRSQSETSGHCRPATGPQGLGSRALHELQQQQLKQGQKDLYQAQLGQPQQQQQQPDTKEEPEAAGSAAAGPQGGNGWQAPRCGSGKLAPRAGSFTRMGGPDDRRGSARSRHTPLTLQGGSFGSLQSCLEVQGEDGQGRQQQHHHHLPLGSGVTEPVTASLVGTFSFKGSGVFEMVQVQQGQHSGRVFQQETPKGKGMRLSFASGPVSGLPPVQLPVPAMLLAARKAFLTKGGGTQRASEW